MLEKDLKERLNIYAAIYGTLDPRTLEVSKKVDKIITKEMEEIQERKRILCKGFN